MPVRAVLLDAFGTLLDWPTTFTEANENALRRALAEADGVVTLPPFHAFMDVWVRLREKEHAEKAESLAEMNREARFRDTLTGLGLNARRTRVLARRMRERYCRELANEMRLAGDALDALKALPDVKLALVSNYGDGDGMRAALDRLGLYYRFDAIAISGDVGVRKPHPRVFEHALAELDVAPADALMVGDDPERDAAAALKVGLRAALVANPRDALNDHAAHGPAPEGVPVLASLHDLPALVARLD